MLMAKPEKTERLCLDKNPPNSRANAKRAKTAAMQNSELLRLIGYNFSKLSSKMYTTKVSLNIQFAMGWPNLNGFIKI